LPSLQNLKEIDLSIIGALHGSDPASFQSDTRWAFVWTF
jgi:phosphopentomutase